MCGITGIVDLKASRTPERPVLQAMRDSLSHRGPDGEGLFIQPGVGLGHRRLAIIDLAGGQQPISDPAQQATLVFNGEIYNYQELRAQLQSLGVTFRTQSDSEVILMGWLTWGAGVVERLRGMFAFALWEHAARTLHLVRDRLGIKPLYYGVTPSGWLLFGSELKALLQHPEQPRQIDPSAVVDYFTFGYLPDPVSIYQGVQKLEPGCMVRFSPGSLQGHHQRYWDLDFTTQSIGEADAQQQLEEQLVGAVASHMVSDVPIGAFLSGGVDSSVVAAQMAAQSVDPILALTIGFGQGRAEQAHDESPYAQAVAAHIGANHQIDRVDPHQLERLQQLPSLYDEPFADSSAWPTWLVCEAARRSVKVVLSGDGGDENFAGYDRHGLFMAEQAVRARIPAALRRLLFRPLGALYPKLDFAPRFLRAKTTFQALGISPIEGLLWGNAILNPSQRSQLLSQDLNRLDHQPISHYERLLKGIPDGDFFQQMLYLDFKTFLASRVLTKVDRASMAVGLEVRVPLLDHQLVGWAAGLPANYKRQGGEGKRLLKQHAARLVPKQTVYRPKMGFNLPLAAWLRGPLKPQMEALSRSQHLHESGLFDRQGIGKMVQGHLSGMQNHASSLWALWMFEGFLKRVHQR
uniref:asparagine synthase (glutamine-hydrolyzing) n=1 Tax=Magnetococcus massalia (strain MO-1) TaxID=451514 RepID=A0A1S7LMI5_MAGMO|nr:Putative asparagine synthase (Glutamine-hydrolyzing) [Candidatus Magnetococcus massalia]